MSAIDVSKAMGIGINLGQTFDNVQHSFEPERVNALLESWWEKGYKNVRIPVTWKPKEGKGTIVHEDEHKLECLDSAIDKALELGFYVVLNTHHEEWLCDCYSGEDELNEGFAELWTLIATRYQDRSEMLIFEILNEPHGVFGAWGGTENADPHDKTSIELSRAINLVGYNAIRAVAPDRILLLQPNAKGNACMVPYVYPTPDALPGGGEDTHLGISVHTYDPWTLCGEDGTDEDHVGAEGIEKLHASIDGILERLAKWETSMDGTCAVHVGEFGIGRRDQSLRDLDLIRDYYSYVTKSVIARGWCATVWDDQGWYAVSKMDGDEVVYPLGFADAMFSVDE